MEDPSPFGARDDEGVEIKKGRYAARDSMLLAATLRVSSRIDAVALRVRNISAGGLMAECPVPVSIGERVEVELRNVGAVDAIVAWVREGRIGLAFDRQIDPKAARKPVGQSKLKTEYAQTIFAPPKPRRRIG